MIYSHENRIIEKSAIFASEVETLSNEYRLRIYTKYREYFDNYYPTLQEAIRAQSFLHKKENWNG